MKDSRNRLLRSPQPHPRAAQPGIKSTRFTDHRGSAAAASPESTPLNRIQSLSALASPKLQVNQTEQTLFDLRVENFHIKFNIKKVRSEMDDFPSAFMEEELQTKINLIKDFEENWEKVCTKYEIISNNKENSENELATLYKTLKTLKTDVENSEQAVEQLRSKQSEMTDKARELEEEYAQLLSTNGPVRGSTRKQTVKKVSKEMLRRKLDKINSDHKNQVKQLKWEEDQLKPGVEAIVKNVKHARGLLDSKIGVHNKLQTQLNELMGKT